MSSVQGTDFMVHRYYSIHSAHTAAPQCAAGASARLSDRFRPRTRRPHVQNMLVRRGSNKQQPRQAHSERLCRTCTHASMQREGASRGHGRTACMQEGHRCPVGACAPTGMHCAGALVSWASEASEVPKGQLLRALRASAASLRPPPTALRFFVSTGECGREQASAVPARAGARRHGHSRGRQRVGGRGGSRWRVLRAG